MVGWWWVGWFRCLRVDIGVVGGKLVTICYSSISISILFFDTRQEEDRRTGDGRGKIHKTGRIFWLLLGHRQSDLLQHYTASPT